MLILGASFACAQSLNAQSLTSQSLDSPEVMRAKSGIEYLRSLVDRGVAPRAQLERAEAALADAEDDALLRRTVYGSGLTDAQADEMLAAAARRVERRQKTLDEAQKLVTAGIAAQNSLNPLREDLEAARKEGELAELRARYTHELTQMVEAEQLLESKLAHEPQAAGELADRFDGDGVFSMAEFSAVESAFEKQFGKPLPVSALGETALHRSLGFDHRGRVDVALRPDQAEGRWLLEYLTGKRIPYFAFRQAVPGKATGAHIHIGPMSTHLKAGA
jgi:hypothetical protein